MGLNTSNDDTAMDRDNTFASIKQAIEQADYDTAKELLVIYKNTWKYDEDIAILEGEYFISTGQAEQAVYCIEQGLTYNSSNYELYFMLGEAYELSSCYECAELCYRYSIFQCHNREDLPLLKDNLERFLNTFGPPLPSLSLIIKVSANTAWLKLFLHMLPLYTMPDSYEVFFIESEPTDEMHKALEEQKLGKVLSYNESDLISPYNKAIDLADRYSDLLIVDEGGLPLEHTIFNLQLTLYRELEVGACGSISNHPSCNKYLKQACPSAEEALSYAHKYNIPLSSDPANALDLPGPFYLLKRSLLKRLGWFDPSFSQIHYQMKDYLFRLIDGKYKVLLCPNSLSLLTAENPISWDSCDLDHIYKKWGIRLTYSCFSRDDLISLINIDEGIKDQPFNVLEIGCACGATLIEIKRRFCNASLYGIELDEGPSSIASHFASISNENIEKASLNYPENFFDYIIFGDVLEHLREPGQVLTTMKRYLKEGGSILASIPNVMHISVMKPLLSGYWTYEDAGILDRTHLKFFTYEEIMRLFKSCGYCVGPVSATTVPISEEDKTLISKLASIKGVPETWFQAYQYLITATKLDEGRNDGHKRDENSVN